MEEVQSRRRRSATRATRISPSSDRSREVAAFAKFDETVEVAVRLGVDPRHADQVVRGTVVLPAGTGKTVRVLVIADGDKASEAEQPAPISSAPSTSRRSRKAGSTSTS